MTAAATTSRIGVDGAQLHVAEAGPPDGPAVVVLHGICGVHDGVLDVDVILRAGMRVIAYDARAHGRSSRSVNSTDYSYAGLAADLEAVLDALDVYQPVLVGASMGALTAIRLLLDDPRRARALVAVTPAFDPSASLTAQDRRRAGRFIAALRSGDLATIEAADPLAGDVPAITSGMRKLLGARMRAHQDLDALADAIAALINDSAFDDLKDLRRLGMPCLVVGSHDEWDVLHPHRIAVAYAETIPRSDFVCEEPGHPPLAWRPRRLARAIVGFSDSLNPSESSR